ncbi:hypothetical protein JB92DRAFT_3031897 [Gautieria morchelliformis]|nr:hypothetical protein JB92DRAFT_3031897 [Gautieria morchelliformis]
MKMSLVCPPSCGSFSHNPHAYVGNGHGVRRRGRTVPVRDMCGGPAPRKHPMPPHGKIYGTRLREPTNRHHHPLLPETEPCSLILHPSRRVAAFPSLTAARATTLHEAEPQQVPPRRTAACHRSWCGAVRGCRVWCLSGGIEVVGRVRTCGTRGYKAGTAARGARL